jgi:hypothetical protein
MTQDWRSLKSPTTFLHSQFSNNRDLGLVAQLELWNTTRAVFERFGADIESSAASEKLDEVERLGQAYTDWHRTWCGILGVNDLAGSIAELFYNCALLYLYSHIHRGGNRTQRLDTDARLTELHDRFRSSAHAVLRTFGSGKLRMLDLPSYFGTMLAFATVSLIKVVRDGQVIEDKRQDIMQLLRELTHNFRQIKLPSSSSHPYVGVARGLEQVAESLFGSADQSAVTAVDVAFDNNILMDDIWNLDFTDFGSNWMGFGKH